MSLTADIEGMRLTVPPGWWIWKYDDSDFHQKQGFQNFAGGSQAVDAVALEPGGTLWLIELKDYRKHPRRKAGTVFEEVAGKVRSTLAGLAVARIRAGIQLERSQAEQALRCSRIRVVLQLAQAGRQHRLFPQVVDPVDADVQLRRCVKQVDEGSICASGSLGDQNARLAWNTVDI